MKKTKKQLNKSKVMLITCIALLILVIIMILIVIRKGYNKQTSSIVTLKSENQISSNARSQAKTKLDWKLILVNTDNKLPENYQITLESIDSYRKFDSRAIGFLKDMINDMRRQNAAGIWVQSSYRSVEEQTLLYKNKVDNYIKMGKREAEAKRLTEQVISKPGHSEHNLGFAVDFNYVNNSFENTQEFQWLKKNAENYGFILRYPKNKENITKMTYEPWHWRYVGEENAKKMNSLGLCLEEYIEYLS